MKKLSNLKKQKKGITLIALVITIIVLLILAAVSIATLTGQNGILTKASESKTKTDRAAAKEKVQIEVAGSMGTDLTVDMDLLKDNLKKNLGLTDEDITENDDGSITIPVDGYTFTVSPNGKITDNGEVPKEPEKVEGSSLDWQVNEAGDTIIAYIGSGFDGDTIVIPNCINDIMITTVGNGSCIFSDKQDLINDKKLKISNEIQYIGNNAFIGCSTLIGDLDIPNTVKTIGHGAFMGCTGFNGNLTIPEGVKEIQDSAFFADKFSGKLEIPNTVEIIGNSAFAQCGNFTGDLYLSKSITKLGPSAFANCRGLNGTLTIGMINTNTSDQIAPNYFLGIRFKNLILEDTVRIIGSSTFQSQHFLEPKLVLPNEVEEIGQRAFCDCSFEGNLVIPSSVKKIGLSAFYGNNFTGDLTIPSSVQEIGETAFAYCNNFDGTLTIGCSIIPSSVFSSAKFKKLILEDTVVTIEGNVFTSWTNLKGELIIPNSVTSIGSYAFAGCTGLTGELIIPNSVNSISDYAFSNCTGFTSIKIMNSDAQVDSLAFNGCSVSPTYGN